MKYSQIKQLCKKTGLKASELNLNDWLILTDKQATQMTREYLSETLWAFSTNFLQFHMKGNVSHDILKSIQSQCEAANPVIEALLIDKNKLIEDAIDCDGRGHFLSHCDGTEYELVDNNNNVLYAYKQN